MSRGRPHFVRYERIEDAVRGKGGKVDEAPAVEKILGWLRALVGN